MAKSFNASQFKSKMRSIESQFNRDMRKYTSEVNRAISNYNNAVRCYNTTTRRNQQIITRELNKLKQQSTITSSASFSFRVLHESYVNVGQVYYDGVEVTERQDRVLDLVEQEHANSIITENSIMNNATLEEDTADIEIGNKLLNVSADLNSRWKGAVFALNPNNPDAARHFCTSTRELFTDFIEIKAPDLEVFRYNPNASKTERGNATRKEKIKFMMRNLDMNDCVAEFADADITNILELFHVLSTATHGEAGEYSYTQLLRVKKRVEQGINFLCEISA